MRWDKVIVTLVDERWVDETSDRSNARLVKASLLQGRAALAEFVPLYQGGEADSIGLLKANKALSVLPEFDAVILGMGNDGHTASFFPGGDTLAEALTAEGPAITLNAAGGRGAPHHADAEAPAPCAGALSAYRGGGKGRDAGSAPRQKVP